MKRAYLVVACLGLVAGCGASPGSTAPSSTDPQTTSPASASPTPVLLSCTELTAQASLLPAEVTKVSLAVGTATDPAANLLEVARLVDALSDNTAMCAPQAASQIAALWTATRYLRQHYLVGTDAVSIASDDQLLSEMRASGIAAWKALGYPTTGWQSLSPPAA